MKRIYPRVSNKPLPNDAKGPLPVDVCRSTTLLLKLPNILGSLQCRRILGGRQLLVYVRTVVTAIFDVMTEED